MTFQFNGIGTGLYGDRWLTKSDYQALSKNKDFLEVLKALKHHKELDIKTDQDLFRFRIATKAFSLIWFPIIPLETFIYYSPKVKWYENEKYLPLFFPNGEHRVDWNHVKKSWSFYTPIALILIIIWGVIFG